MADGLGYTWLWPDGVVTYAAHYPVGYPALLALPYAALGHHVVSAMLVNAAIGALAAPAAYGLAAQVASRRGALLAGFAVALHPALAFYTPALMTEGVVGSLIVVAAWLIVRARDTGWLAVAGLGLVLGAATLMRPQTLLLAPVFGLLSARAGVRDRLVRATAASLLAFAVCLPWTLRNCVRMDRCVLVSANGGWNLLIGASPSANGTFAPVADELVPTECREVFGESAKDACFGAAAARMIAERPLAWLALAPKKLAHTFDYGGAAGWYLNASNARAMGERAKLALGVAETIWQRLLLALALAALAAYPGPRKNARLVIGALAGVMLLGPAAWLSHVGLVIQGALLGPALARHLPAAVAVAAVAATGLAHVVFFGAGRYSMVVYPAVAALAGALFRRDEPLSPSF